jgi:hypothetical protein
MMISSCDQTQTPHSSEASFHLPQTVGAQQYYTDSDDGEHKVPPMGVDDVNLWTTAVPETTEVEICIQEWQERIHRREPLESEDLTEDTDEEEQDSSVPDIPVKTSTFAQGAAIFRYMASTALLAFCTFLVGVVVFSKQTNATSNFNIPPAVAFSWLCLVIMWLSLLEGGLNCMVGLQQISKNLYADSHDWASRATALAHKGNNIERFIVGRQFLDLTCIFTINFLATPIKGATVYGLPTIVCDIFLNSGLSVILVTIVFAQLTSQINCAHSMLDFINNRAMYLSTLLALGVEKSGLLHSVYLIQMGFAKMAGMRIETNEQQRSLSQKVLFWGRVVLSMSILLFSIVVMLVAMFQGKTRMWSAVPPAASLFMLIALILFMGLLDGLQVAFFAVLHLPEKEIKNHKVAWKNCKFVFSGQNLQTFLVGRQIFQTTVQFFIARLSTVKMDSGDDTLMNVPSGVQRLFNTGILGSIFATIIASLIWRVTASCFPFLFLSNPLSHCFIRICIFVEKTGVCWSAWLVAAVHRKVAGLKLDETYTGKRDCVAFGESDSCEEDDFETVTEGGSPRGSLQGSDSD